VRDRMHRTRSARPVRGWYGYQDASCASSRRRHRAWHPRDAP
jgi:hypothetical protein